MKIWFTSDTHYWHKNIIQYSNRPVEGIEAMNALLIKNWQERVKEDDLVYHLGDFFFCGAVKAAAILKQLPGRKIWIRGNHDSKVNTLGYFFEEVTHYKMIYVDIPYEDEEEKPQVYHQPIVLFHFPIASWDGMAHGSWHLHGHCHGSFPDNGSLRMDVGVDCWNMSPVSVEEITKEMVMRTVVPVDHHDKRENNPRFKHLLKIANYASRSNL